MASEPFVNQMRRGDVHVNASRKTFMNIYARFHTFYRMEFEKPSSASYVAGCDAPRRFFSRDSYREDLNYMY